MRGIRFNTPYLVVAYGLRPSAALTVDIAPKTMSSPIEAPPGEVTPFIPHRVLHHPFR